MFSLDALELWEIESPFRVGFRHAAAARRSSRALFVVARAGRHAGYGEILPRSYVTGESLESCVADVKERWWPKLKELRFGSEAPFETLRALYEEADAARKTASYAGIDVAAFDLWARVHGIPGARMFKDAPEACALTGVIGVGWAAGAAARAYRLLGCKDFKLKVGATAIAPAGGGGSAETGDLDAGRAPADGPMRHDAGGRGASDAAAMARTVAVGAARRASTRDGARSVSAVERDAAAILAVRRAIGPDAPLILDANGAYSERDAAALLARWSDLGINGCEEPLAYPDPEALAQLARATSLDLIADESLCTTDDARRHLATRGAAVWNLRLAKVGGFSGVRALAALAEAHGVRLVLGSLVGESSVLGAAARAALGLASFERAEAAASAWLLRRDPFTGPRGAPRGAVLGPLGERPGLGVEPRAGAARKGLKTLFS